MYNPLNICDIHYIEITYNDHSKKTFKLNRPCSRNRVVDLIAKFSDSKLYWAIKGYTKFNTSI